MLGVVRMLGDAQAAAWCTTSKVGAKGGGNPNHAEVRFCYSGKSPRQRRASAAQQYLHVEAGDVAGAGHGRRLAGGGGVPAGQAVPRHRAPAQVCNGKRVSQHNPTTAARFLGRPRGRRLPCRAEGACEVRARPSRATAASNGLPAPRSPGASTECVGRGGAFAAFAGRVHSVPLPGLCWPVPISKYFGPLGGAWVAMRVPSALVAACGRPT